MQMRLAECAEPSTVDCNYNLKAGGFECAGRKYGHDQARAPAVNDFERRGSLVRPRPFIRGRSERVAPNKLNYIKCLNGGRTRTRTLDPLIKRLLNLSSCQVVSCKTPLMRSFCINGLRPECKKPISLSTRSPSMLKNHEHTRRFQLEHGYRPPQISPPILRVVFGSACRKWQPATPRPERGRIAHRRLVVANPARHEQRPHARCIACCRWSWARRVGSGIAVRT
jgi:hypothetical protein